MPEKHRRMGEWTPDRFIGWAEKIGPDTAALITAVLDARRHPQQAYRSCIGLQRLAKCYGDARLEAAAARGERVAEREKPHHEPGDLHAGRRRGGHPGGTPGRPHSGSC